MYDSLRFEAPFHEEVDNFIEAAKKHVATLIDNKDTIICPCKDCENTVAFTDSSIIKEHLIRRGFVRNYTVWIHHGETMAVDDDGDVLEDDAETLQYLSQYSDQLAQQMDHDLGNDQGGDIRNEQGGDFCNDGGAREGDKDDGDNLDEMLRAVGPEILLQKRGLQNLERVTKASKETVYGVEKGCPTHWTLLRFMLELLILKAKYGWSDCSFDDLLCLLAWLLPQPNSVPANTYYAKKVISPLTMGVEKIHACPNHCILFRGDTFKDLDKCPRCGASRYKDNDLYSGGEASTGNKRNKKGGKKAVQESQQPENTPLGNDAKKRRIPALVMWYLSVTDRLRRIFLNPKEAALMTWWQDERKVANDMITHPADCSQWKDFDKNNKEFNEDQRKDRSP